MADHSEHIHDTLADDKIGGATKASPGRPPAEFYSSMNIPAQFSMAGNYYHERCLQLEGQLTDANRKIQQITDELFQARKDLSQDKTELLLAHQNEIARLKEEFRDKLDGLKEANNSKVQELEKKIEYLDREQFKKDLEYQSSQQSPGNQFVEHVIKKTPDFIDTIGGVISIIAGQRNGVSPVSMHSAQEKEFSTATESISPPLTHPGEQSSQTSGQSQSELPTEKDQPEEQNQTSKPSTTHQ